MPFGQACLDALHAALDLGRSMGFETFNHENYCGTLLWKGESDTEIGFFGHADVVPAGNGWTCCEPFSKMYSKKKPIAFTWWKRQSMRLKSSWLN